MFKLRAIFVSLFVTACAVTFAHTATAQQAIGSGSNPNGGACGSGNCLSGVAAPFPSFSPTSVVPHVAISPTPAATMLPTGTVTSGQVAIYGCKLANVGGVSPCIGETWNHVGLLHGTNCDYVAAVYDHEPATSTVITAAPNEDGCSADMPGDSLLAVNALPAPSPIVSSQLAQQGDFYTQVRLNGVSTAQTPGYTGTQWTFSRGSGTSFVVLFNTNGHDIEFTWNSYTLAQVAASVLAPPAVAKSFLGTFGRGACGPPYGMLDCAVPPANAPIPYPTTPASPSPANLYSFCTTPAATNGLSIVTANPVDTQALTYLVTAGVQWTRSSVQSPNFDISHLSGPGTPTQQVAFAPVDALECAQLLNGIEPVVEIDNSYPNYGTYNPVSGPYFSGTSNRVYKSPDDYGAWCSTVATHMHNIFPEIRRFEILDNEINIDMGYVSSDVALTNNPAAYLGVPGVVLYAQDCYKNIKAVDPTYFVYFGELAMNSNLNPVSFMQQMYALGCRINTCYDGISIHMSPAGQTTAQYDPAMLKPGNYVANGPPGYMSYDMTIAAIQGFSNTIHQTFGETQFIHFLISESGYQSIVAGGSEQGSEADQWYMWSYWLYAGEELACGAPTQPGDFCIDGIAPQNLGEDSQYRGSPFADWGIWDTIETLPRPRPALAALQAVSGINPSAPPTIMPGSIASSPIPSATPQLDAVIRGLDATASYPLSETSGTTAVDRIANYNAVYSGAVTPGANTPLTINNTAAPTFAFASSGAVTTNIPVTVPALNGQLFTCAMSVNLTQAPYGQHVCANDFTSNTGLGTATNFDTSGSGHIRWCLGLTSGTSCITTTSGFTTNTTYRILETWNGVTGIQSLYVNDVLVAYGTGKTGTMKQTPYSLDLTTNPNTGAGASSFSGSMQEFYFGPFAALQAQVDSDYIAATGNSAASPSIVQGAVTNAASSSLATPPANGNFALGIAFAQPGTLADSNNATPSPYTSKSTVQNTNGPAIQVFDGFITNSPSKTFTFSIGSSQIEAIFELKGVSAALTSSYGTYTPTGSTAGLSAVATTSASMPANSMIWCAFRDDYAHLTALTLSNVTGQTTYWNNAQNYYIIYGKSTAAGPGVCTATFSATGDDPVLTVMAYHS